MNLAKKKTLNQQRGMTLIEMLLCLVLGSIFFIMLSSMWLMCFKQYHAMRQEQKRFYELHKIRQFIEDEIQLAETVCIYIYKGPIDETTVPIDLSHTSHNTISYEIPMGHELPVKQIIFDKGKVNKNLRHISTTLKRKQLEEKEGVFELNYQSNTLSDCVTKFVVRQGVDVCYMTIGIEVANGEREELTFTLPLQDKEEKKVGELWSIQLRY